MLVATNLEALILADDLYADVDSKPVKFTFERGAEGPMKYLFKVCQSNRASKQEPTFGAKIDKLSGQILNLSTAFIHK